MSKKDHKRANRVVEFSILVYSYFNKGCSDPTQAYATRPKGSVGSCKSDLV